MLCATGPAGGNGGKLVVNIQRGAYRDVAGNLSNFNRRVRTCLSSRSPYRRRPRDPGGLGQLDDRRVVVVQVSETVDLSAGWNGRASPTRARTRPRSSTSRKARPCPCPSQWPECSRTAGSG